VKTCYHKSDYIIEANKEEKMKKGVIQAAIMVLINTEKKYW
jgi:hypothetical protein